MINQSMPKIDNKATIMTQLTGTYYTVEDLVRDWH
jgi:hypothetical protein